MNEKELRRLINEVTAEIIAESDADMGERAPTIAPEVLSIANALARRAMEILDLDGDDDNIEVNVDPVLFLSPYAEDYHDVVHEDGLAKYIFDNYVMGRAGDHAEKLGDIIERIGIDYFDEDINTVMKSLGDDRFDGSQDQTLMTKDLTAQQDPEDEWYNDEHETLGDRKFADSQANAETDDDRATFSYQGETELEDYPQATHYSDDPTRNDEFMRWSRAVVRAMKDEMIAHPKDIPWLEDVEGNAELALFDEWKAGTSPEEYASLFDQYNAGGLESNDDDERRWNMSESKGFTFDKFMKDINGREDKITQHKKELTESEEIDTKRNLQRLYQEDWRNSVKLRGKK